MKKFKLFYLVIFLFISAVKLNSQVVENNAIASRMFFFNSGGLVSQSSELLSPVSDSGCAAISYSMKTLAMLDGVFYQALSSTKFEANIQKIALRKSADGINWTPLIKAVDSPAGISAPQGNIHVWKKNNNVNIGIVFIDRRSGIDQVRFVKSTNGGTSFLSSVQVSNHASAGDYFLGGIAGKGDTIALCWAKTGAETFFTRSTDGGVTWSTMTQVFTGGFFSIVTDINMDNSGNLYTVIAEDQFIKVNLIVRKSSNLGASWNTSAPVTNVAINQMNHFQQCRFLNNKLYVMWVRNMNTSSHLCDGIFLSESTNGAASWSAPVDLSDADTLYESALNFPLEMHPSFAVTPGGVMYAAWSDSRAGNSPTFDSCKFNIYLSRSTNGGASWSQNILVNGPSNFPRVSNCYADISVKSSGGMDSVLVTWTKRRDVSTIGIIQTSTQIPERFSLMQNYPNPFNPVTNIKFNNTKAGNVQILVYDGTGKFITYLVNDELSPGTYNVDFDASKFSSGLFFCFMKTAGYTETRKMVLIK